MNIDLLSKMVKELMQSNDSVTLPGLGSFAADLVPASFTDKGYTITPPYRRLYFIPTIGADTLLPDLYASSNSISREDATRILLDFLSELKEILSVKKVVVFPGLGRLRATRENNFFFVADEDLDIYPAGIGLAPISLKTHEETPEEVVAAVSGLAEILAEPQAMEPAVAKDPVAEPAPATVSEPESEPVEDSVAKEAPSEPAPVPVAQPAKKRGGWFWKTLLVLVMIAAVLALALALAGHFAPQWLDRYLYSSEELDIIEKAWN